MAFADFLPRETRETASALLGSIKEGIGAEEFGGQLKEFIDSGGDLNNKGIGSYLLGQAIKCGHLELCRCLLKTEANFNLHASSGMPALHIAVQLTDREEVLQLLLEHGLEVNVQSITGNTPLLEAVRCLQLSKVKLLLDHAADLHAMNNGGDSALHIAALLGSVEIVQLLLEDGIPVNIKKKAKKRGSSEGTSSLPIHYAIFGGQMGFPEVTEVLLDAGADPDAPMSNGRTALHIAAMRGSVQIAEQLINRGCNLNAISMDNNENKTPLFKALDFRHLDVAQLLICKGADVNIADQWGSSPLCCALFNVEVNFVVALLVSGAHLKNVTQNSMTPLDLAIHCPLSVTKMLVSAGCQPYCRRTLEMTEGISDEAQPVLDYFAECMRTPYSLKQTSRLVIRRALDDHLHKKISLLGLPRQLQCYLHLNDVIPLEAITQITGDF